MQKLRNPQLSWNFVVLSLTVRCRIQKKIAHTRRVDAYLAADDGDQCQSGVQGCLPPTFHCACCIRANEQMIYLSSPTIDVYMVVIHRWCGREHTRLLESLCVQIYSDNFEINLFMQVSKRMVSQGASWQWVLKRTVLMPISFDI